MIDVRLFIGLPAAGKSTFYRTHFASTHALVSKDLLQNNRRPARRQAHLLAAHLAAGRSVVVDNTHPSVASRAEVFAVTQPLGVRVIGYYFHTEMAACLARNAQRTGRARVPDVALFACAAQMTAPTWAEGFAHLFDVRLVEDGFVITANTEPCPDAP